MKSKTITTLLGVSAIAILATGCQDGYNQWKDSSKAKTITVYSTSTGEPIKTYKSMGIVSTRNGRSSFYDSQTGEKVYITGNHSIK